MAQGNQSFLCIRPLFLGILTDRFDSWEAVPEGHHLMRRTKGEYPDAFRQRQAITRVFRDEIRGSMTRFAMRFRLFSPVVSSMIVGMNSVAQVTELAGMLDGIAPRPEVARRAFDLWQSGFADSSATAAP